MKLFKSFAAMLLVVAMLFSFAACHPKDEIAVSIDGIEFTSAYYMCALINADTEARALVDASLEEKAEDTTEITDVNYYSQKVENTDFVKWVKNRALESLKDIAVCKIKCKEADISPDETTLSTAEQYANMYWNNYGYSSLFEPNGVSFATYSQYMKDSYYSSSYFEHLYGEGGDKEIPAADVKTEMLENFVIADVIDFTSSSEATVAENKATITLITEYYNRIKAGTMTFEEAYKDYNKIEDTEQTTDPSLKVEAPEDQYATLLGSNDTNYASNYFDTVKNEMKTGEIKLITKENDQGAVLIIKKDIEADPYYLKNLDTTLRDMLKGDEYTEYLKECAKELEADINKYAVNQFKVKKIVYPY